MNKLFIFEEQINFGQRHLFISAKTKEDAIIIALEQGAFSEMKSGSIGIVRVLEALNSIHKITVSDIKKGGLLHSFEFSE